MRIPALSKTYCGRVALDLSGFELPDDAITAVIGPNGSGKTTLARILAGTERADRNGKALPEIAVGYLPQKSCAFRMSTEKNLLLNGGSTERALALMEELGLTPLARQSAKKLSGGETAKMALCRLLMGRYDLLILDEPTASMDMESTLAAEKLIASYREESACTVLLITHSIQQARRLSDHVVFLDHGKVVEAGPAEKILQAPEQEMTRRFLEFYGL